MADVIPFPMARRREFRASFLSELFDPNCPCPGCKNFYTELDKAIQRKINREKGKTDVR